VRLGEICIEPCDIEHGCCCDCDGCPGGEWAQLEGPVEPPVFGPHTPYGDDTASSFNWVLKKIYTPARLEALLVPTPLVSLIRKP
jgi:hypothetical protein